MRFIQVNDVPDIPGLVEKKPGGILLLGEGKLPVRPKPGTRILFMEESDRLFQGCVNPIAVREDGMKVTRPEALGLHGREYVVHGTEAPSEGLVVSNTDTGTIAKRGSWKNRGSTTIALIPKGAAMHFLFRRTTKKNSWRIVSVGLEGEELTNLSPARFRSGEVEAEETALDV
jgi:hypothetical protein